jgi:hypothetical protein
LGGVRCLAGQQELHLRSSVLEENQNEEPGSRDLLRHHMHAGIIQPRRTYMSQAQGGVLKVKCSMLNDQTTYSKTPALTRLASYSASYASFHLLHTGTVLLCQVRGICKVCESIMHLERRGCVRSLSDLNSSPANVVGPIYASSWHSHAFDVSPSILRFESFTSSHDHGVTVA